MFLPLPKKQILMNKNYLILGWMIWLFTFNSCDIINPEEDIPAYIYIPEISLTTNVVSEGTASEKINVAYVFVDNQDIGIYALPATIPILETGDRTLEIFAGIRENGVPDVTAAYPFYQSYEMPIDLVSGQVDTIRPVVRYRGDASFVFSPEEDFESSISAFDVDLDGNDETGLEITNLDVFEGMGAGLIQLNADDEQVEVGSNLLTGFPDGGRPVYLEMNYKTDITFVVGVLGYNTSGELVEVLIDKGVNPKEDWNKIYFNFTEEIRRLSISNFNIGSYRFVIYANMQGTDLTEAKIFLDNIKLIQLL